jgi:hypothetical protein
MRDADNLSTRSPANLAVGGRLSASVLGHFRAPALQMYSVDFTCIKAKLAVFAGTVKNYDHALLLKVINLAHPCLFIENLVA